MSATPQERLALGVAALLLAVGAGARTLRPAPPAPRWAEPAAAASDSVTVRRLTAATGDSVARKAERDRPLAAGELIDPNTAPADALQRLPRVGPALAERIVAWRAAHGRFGSLAGLDSVPGVGPSLLTGMAKHVTLAAGPASPLAVASRAGASVGLVDINVAGAAELDALPGIGPALAGRIVAYRQEHGRFGTLDDLARVPGIGPAAVAKLRGRARATP
ncbi:MAG TPA: ComEA family DNA-binding protein [Longimicrobium sp.]|nr:ComEA family DNA-binding protein [Longimicrobium sp.]